MSTSYASAFHKHVQCIQQCRNWGPLAESMHAERCGIQHLGISESGASIVLLFCCCRLHGRTMLSRTRTTLWLCGSCFSLRFGVRTSHWHALAFPNGFAWRSDLGAKTRWEQSLGQAANIVSSGIATYRSIMQLDLHGSSPNFAIQGSSDLCGLQHGCGLRMRFRLATFLGMIGGYAVTLMNFMFATVQFFASINHVAKVVWMLFAKVIRKAHAMMFPWLVICAVCGNLCGHAQFGTWLFLRVRPASRGSTRIKETNSKQVWVPWGSALKHIRIKSGQAGSNMRGRFTMIHIYR